MTVVPAKLPTYVQLHKYKASRSRRPGVTAD
jgi:hypothetical protein